MKQKLFLLQLPLCLMITLAAFAQAPVRAKWLDQEPKMVTLFARAEPPAPTLDSFPRNPGYGKSAFSFKFGLRSDAGTDKTRNDWELLYGNFNWSGDKDWFSVVMVVDDCSRIKDLGALQWSEIAEVPFLPASSTPGRALRILPRTLPEGIEESSDGHTTRVVLGHLYVLHSKDRDSDFYTLFRVEELVHNSQVTISWKNVPSPKSPK